jgi:2'-hydroxyisoflavone reductase
MEKLLIIGGTQFIGRNLLLKLQESNKYDITLFNRGKTNASLFPQFKRIIGDRNTDDISKIGQEEWDYIIDLSCYYPDSLEKILPLIKDSVKRYVFVSTCSVYDRNENKSSIATLENGPLLDCSKEQETESLPAAYGNKKVACERLLAASGLDYISLRPSLVYGAYDHTDRLYYWLYQVKHKTPILVPDHGERLFSITYVTDLVHAIIKSLNVEVHSNIYNVISEEFTSIKNIIATASDLLNRSPQIISATPDFLHQHQIQEWTTMPLWIDGDYFTYSDKKLITDFDISLSDWTKSIQETVDYYETLDWSNPIYGLPDTKRLELISLI